MSAILLPLGQHLRAQPGVAHARDSLLHWYENADTDTSRVWALMETGKLYLNSNGDSAARYIDQALQLAESINFDRGIAKCRINKAYLANDQGNYDEAIALCNAAIPICERLDMKLELAATYNNLGNAWNFRGNHWMAISSYEKSLVYMEQATVPAHFPLAVQTNLTILYRELKLTEKAQKISRQVFENAQYLEDETTAAIAALHLGQGYHTLQLKDSARQWLEHALEIGQKIEYPTVLSAVLGTLGDIMLEEGHTAGAEVQFREGLRIAKSGGDKNGMMINLHGLSLLYFRQQEWMLAEDYAQRAMAIADSMPADDYKSNIYLTFSDIKLVQKNIDAWFDYRQKYYRLKDQLANRALIHALQELDTRYKTQAKEKAIIQLQQEKDRQAQRLEHQQLLIWVISSLSFLLLIGGMLGWRNFHHRRKLANQEKKIREQQLKELEQEKLLSVADAMLQGQEKERTRLARDLHDSLGGMLSGIKQTIFAMKGNRILDDASGQTFNQLIGMLNYSIEELRHIARNMMPEALVRFGLKDALQDYCGHIGETGGVKVHFQAFGINGRLAVQIEVVLFRIAQELLNNVVKHAEAANVLVQLIRDDHRLFLTIEDDGKGFDIDKLSTQKGIGWLNIQSRVDYLKGTLDIQSKPGRGTSVNIEFNLT